MGKTTQDIKEGDLLPARISLQEQKTWKELRTRNIILACLSKHQYGNVLELACGTGTLSVKLANRSHQLACCDCSADNLVAAARRVGDKPNVRFLQRQLPKQWPSGRYDLIVINNLAKRFDFQALTETTVRLRESLLPKGLILACHWRSSSKEKEHYTADQVHQHISKRLGRPSILHHEEPDFLLDIWQHRP